MAEREWLAGMYGVTTHNCVPGEMPRTTRKQEQAEDEQVFRKTKTNGKTGRERRDAARYLINAQMCRQCVCVCVQFQQLVQLVRVSGDPSTLGRDAVGRSGAPPAEITASLVPQQLERHSAQ